MSNISAKNDSPLVGKLQLQIQVLEIEKAEAKLKAKRLALQLAYLQRSYKKLTAGGVS